MVKFIIVRTVLSIAASQNWETRQLDISNAFLHGFLDKELFMEQPIGFIDKQNPDYVCKLQKSLYGLK